MGAICGKVETQGESRKEVEEDCASIIAKELVDFAVIEWVSAVDANHRVKDQEKLARSRRPVMPPRGHRTMPGCSAQATIIARRPATPKPPRTTASLKTDEESRRLPEATSGPCEAS